MTEKSKAKRKVSRRSFLRLIGVTGLFGISANLTGCGAPTSPDRAAGGTGWIPSQYNIPGNWPTQVKGRISIDANNPSIMRDDQKCILCGQCIEVCEKVQTVYGYYHLPLKNDVVCVHCGQCTHWCPTASIVEVDHTQRVYKALQDPDTIVIAQTAPSIRVALGEDFGLPVGTNVEGKMVAGLRKLGFDIVVDTNWAADLTIIEEANEFVHRLTDPEATYNMFTTCCPAWVKFMEYYFPELIPYYSTAKSPQAMMGTMIKTYYAKKMGIDPSKIYSVAIMPCSAKKFEHQREELNDAGEYLGISGMKDIDAVLTTREYALMLRQNGIDINRLTDDHFDNIISQASGAGYIFANSGGVMEAAVRTAYYIATKEQPPASLWNLTPIRGLDGVKEADIHIPGVGEVKVAVVQGLANARKVSELVLSGKAPWRLIEVMACPGGCISGGGQPRASTPPQDRVREKRISAVYEIDREMHLRNSHDNPEIKAIYNDFLGEPIGDLAHKLLHTSYTPKSDLLNRKNPSEYN